MSGHNEYDFAKLSHETTVSTITQIFDVLEIKSDFLNFDPCLEGKTFEQQPAYQL